MADVVRGAFTGTTNICKNRRWFTLDPLVISIELKNIHMVEEALLKFATQRFSCLSDGDHDVRSEEGLASRDVNFDAHVYSDPIFGPSHTSYESTQALFEGPSQFKVTSPLPAVARKFVGGPGATSPHPAPCIQFLQTRDRYHVDSTAEKHSVSLYLQRTDGAVVMLQKRYCAGIAWEIRGCQTRFIIGKRRSRI
jgi:hypothetical protein